jgi:exodeoxyribonuclease (lambda-induced)
MIFHNDPQGSDAWLASRSGVITASKFKDARDRLKSGAPSSKCNAYAAQVALERIAGRPIDKTFQNWQMREGQEQEPFARIAAESINGYMVEEVGFITTDDRVFGYSPDGLIDGDGLLEIKTILSGDVALNVIGKKDLSEYMDQCNGGLWLTGRKWIDLVIWCPALEPIGKHLTIHRIDRDEEKIQALEDDLMNFRYLVDQNEAIFRMKEAA